MTVRVQETGGIATTVSSVTLTFSPSNATATFPFAGTVAANGTLTSGRMTATDNDLNRAVPTAVAARVAFSDTTGNLSATSISTSVPALQVCCTLSGRVTESAPTAGTSLAFALVEITSGQGAGTSVTSDAAGNYTFAGLSGDLSLRATKAGYEADTSSVSMTMNRTVNLLLRPNLLSISENLTGAVSGGDAACVGSFLDRSCRRHAFGVHHNGTFTADMDWAGNADLDLELWRGTTMIARSIGVGSREQISSSVQAGSSYEVRVVYYGGATVANYTVRVTRPN